MQFLFDILCHTICGWLGATFVKIITLGRIGLDWGEGCTKSILAEWTGLVALVGLVVLAFSLWPHLT